MAKVTEKQVNKFLDDIGAGKSKNFGRSQNLYKILGIIPEVDDDGNRCATVYEILRTPPQFRNGKEVPIVFAIKNRTKKLGHYSGTDKLFFYIGKKQEKETSALEETLEDLKKKYKHALFVGNTDEALAFFDLIDSMTGGQAAEIMGMFYNYAVFYKRMKKQLLMDMFAHFFLTYFFRYRNNIKEGIINSSKRFKPYFENTSVTLSGNQLNEISAEEGFVNSNALDFSGIKAIKFDTSAYDTDFVETGVVAEQKQNVPLASIIGKPEISILQSKTEAQKTEDKKPAINEKEDDNKEEEFKSFVKVPKHVKPSFKFFEEEPKEQEESENNLEENLIDEKIEETKSFN